MNDRMSDMDSLVELAARALAMLEPDEDWPTNAALGGNGTGTRDDEYRGALTDQAREILEAVGLPALLERVEAAEGREFALGEALVNEQLQTLNTRADCDALAAKVARVEALLEAPAPPRFESRTGNFLGLASGKEDAHRTVGPHRAWSDTGEWCYPTAPCEACSERIYQNDLRTALDASETV